jgi:preprotein translocase subunit SecE
MAADQASQQANRSGMDPRRLVVIFLLLFGMVFGLFLAQILGLVWTRFSWSDTELIVGIPVSKPTLVLGYALSAALMVATLVVPRMKHASEEVANELMKVTWPSWGETRVSTVAVVVASLVAAGLLFVIDTVAYRLMVIWIPALWGKL